MEEFVNHYEARGWTPNGSSHSADTSRKRVALARNWTPKTGDGRFKGCAACLEWLEKGYALSVGKFGAEKAGAILREVESVRQGEKERTFIIATSARVYGMLNSVKNPMIHGKVEGVRWVKSLRQRETDAISRYEQRK